MSGDSKKIKALKHLLSLSAKDRKEILAIISQPVKPTTSSKPDIAVKPVGYYINVLANDSNFQRIAAQIKLEASQNQLTAG